MIIKLLTILNPPNSTSETLPNTNISYGFLKNRVVTLFLDERTDGSDIVEELKSLYESHLVPIRPNRKSERNPGKYRARINPKIPKNQKDGV